MQSMKNSKLKTIKPKDRSLWVKPLREQAMSQWQTVFTSMRMKFCNITGHSLNSHLSMLPNDARAQLQQEEIKVTLLNLFRPKSSSTMDSLPKMVTATLFQEDHTIFNLDPSQFLKKHIKVWRWLDVEFTSSFGSVSGSLSALILCAFHNFLEFSQIWFHHLISYFFFYSVMDQLSLFIFLFRCKRDSKFLSTTHSSSE